MRGTESSLYYFFVAPCESEIISKYKFLNTFYMVNTYRTHNTCMMQVKALYVYYPIHFPTTGCTAGRTPIRQVRKRKQRSALKWSRLSPNRASLQLVPSHWLVLWTQLLIKKPKILAHHQRVGESRLTRVIIFKQSLEDDDPRRGHWGGIIRIFSNLSRSSLHLLKTLSGRHGED